MIAKHWKGMGLLAAMLAASPALAQVAAPAAGAAAVGGAAAGPGPAPAAVAAAQPGFFQKCCDALDACRRKMCNAPCGQMLNSMTLPLSTMSGGIIPSFCPQMPSAKDLAQPGVAGAADNAKKDALEAKARRAAVRYLGTLDCRYYPEAEIALIAALRSDRIECVRMEAAIAFANGCCCTKKVMEALEICVSGSDRDGNPAERSERVRDFAYIALARCVSCYHETVEVIEEKKEIKELPPAERKEVIPKPNLTQADKELIERSRKTVALYKAKREMTQAVAAQQALLPKGDHSLYQILKYASDGAPQPAKPVMMPASRIVNPEIAPNGTPVNLQPALAPQPRELPDVKMPETKAPPAAELMPVQQAQATPSPAASPVPMDTQSKTIAFAAPETVQMAQAKPFQATSPVPMAAEPKTITFSPPEAVQTGKPADEPMSRPTEIATPAASLTIPTVDPAPAVASKPKTDEETINGLIDELMGSATPLERHQAIRDLAANDWRKFPQILAAFVKAARVDSDRAVRVNAIRHLAALKMDIPYVVEHLKYMEKDRDEWVAQESKEALEKLHVAQ